jgi:hypothetical protein
MSTLSDDSGVFNHRDTENAERGRGERSGFPNRGTERLPRRGLFTPPSTYLSSSLCVLCVSVVKNSGCFSVVASL